jgi:hypothetical protein
MRLMNNVPTLIAIMMQRHAIELLKRIRLFLARSAQPAIQRHTLDFERVASANVNAVALLDVTEVDRVNSRAALVWQDRRLGMPK